jgi:parvulin-like peptidyl-prolyl isomerase
LLPLGDSADLHQALFELRPGELSAPIQVEAGFVILTPKDTQAAHPGTLAEVHDQVLADYQREKSIDLARTRAQDLAKLASSGESFDQAAKSLGIEIKASDPFARNGSIPDVGSGKQLQDAFGMAVGQVSKPEQLADNWIVYRVDAHDAPNPADLAAQTNDIQQQLLQTKQNAAYEAFRTALLDRLKKEGKFTENAEAVNRITKSS